MYKITLTLISLIFIYDVSFSQTEIRKLPPNINRPSINLYAPYISGDGQTLIYLSDYTDDGSHSMRMATRKSVASWNDGQEVTRTINRPSLNFRGGYSLNFDGTQLLFTSRKSGLGGFDIWYSNRKGNDWDLPKNFGKEINTASNEGSPVLSPDGEYLYFMRCDQMSEYKGATGCKIFVSNRKYNSWDSPVELPSNINTGNSQTPRILADGQTLIFSSDVMGGKGGLDLFMTTKSGEGWTDPKPLEFANTAGDDAFVSVPGKGRYMYTTMKERDVELIELLIPEEFQPVKVMRIQGTVTDGVTKAPINANLTVFNIDERDRLWNEKVGSKGEFAIVLKEGQDYDLSVDSDNPLYMYYSKVYELDEIGSRDRDILRIELMPAKTGAVYDVPVGFESDMFELDDIATFELRRMAELLRKNPTMNVELEVHQLNYLEDSIKSNNLTESRIDTIMYNPPIINYSFDDVVYDSLVSTINLAKEGIKQIVIDDTNYNFTVTSDSLLVQEFEVLTNDSTITDSLSSGPPMLSDTLRTAIPLVKFKTVMVYHNNRTEKQGQTIKEYLVGRGVEPERIQIKGVLKRKNDDDPTHKRDVIVKMKVISL